MSAKEKVNLSNLKQTHGALASPSIDELTGQVEGYATSSLEEYRQSLASMSDPEMYDHAVEVAHIVPVGIRSLLVERLERKFIESIGGRGGRAPVTPPPKMRKKDQEFQQKFFEGQL